MLSEADHHRLFLFPEGLELGKQQPRRPILCTYSIHRSPQQQELKARVQRELEAVYQRRSAPDDTRRKQERAIGALMGLAVGDSIGAPLEFAPYSVTGETFVEEMGQEEVWGNPWLNRFRLKSGQWTDDTAMALCLADSLLERKAFDPLDLRLRFHNWWAFGYNNAFGSDHDRPNKSSVGLGGNISQSMNEFVFRQLPFTKAGDRRTSGNGSLMRAAAIPIFYSSQPEACIRYAYAQSKTTHQGDEAAECAMLLSYIISKAIHAPATMPRQTPAERKTLTCRPRSAGPVTYAQWLLSGLDDELNGLLERATSFADSNHPENTLPLPARLSYGVHCLAAARKEESCEANRGLDLADRNWSWKTGGSYRYANGRAREMPGYVGSYCMDALAMALHCVWSTNSFKDAVLKCANMR
eukprot:g56813.t1